MPSNWLSIDSNFPTFTGEEPVEQQIRQLHNYLYQLREGLQYSLQNLTAKNFNTAALQELTDAQKNEVTEQLSQVYKLLSKLSDEVESLGGRIIATENLSERVKTAETTISDLNQRTKVAEGNIADMQGRIVAAEEMAARVTAAEGNITTLTQKVETSEATVTELANRISLLEVTAVFVQIEDEVTGT